MPVLIIFFSWGQGDRSIWSHLLETQMAELVVNTLVLMLGVGTLAGLLGLGLALLITLFEFPGRKQFEWLLMLPMAMPAYVVAFVFLGVFDYAGPVQSIWRDWFGNNAPFPDIRSAFGVILVFSLVLFPYVYMMTRSALIRQGQSMLEAPRMLGLTSKQTLFQVAIPAVRPALVGGISLALMETLADFGTVSVFNYSTFTTAIYKSWYGFRDIHIAGQLASLLMLFVFVALILEQQSRSRAQYRQSGTRPILRKQLSTTHRWQAFAACALVLFAAFILPVIQLVLWVVQVWPYELDSRYLSWLKHTLSLGAMAGVLTILSALIIAYRSQLNGRFWIRQANRLANLGYAVPSSILAVGVMIGFGWLDNQVLLPLAAMMNIQVTGMILTGSLLALLAAYGVRFMAVASSPVQTGLQQIRPSLAESALLLGARPIERWRLVHWPYLRPGILTAFLLVLVDVMKEMPATLIMRPFGWDTLAVRIYELTAEGEWERAAIPAITLVLAGLIPVMLLVRNSRK